MSKKIVLLATLVSVVLIVMYMKMRKTTTKVIIPADELDVDNLAIILDQDLINTTEALESSVTAIINDLETEASEALPSELTPTISAELSEKDSLELQSLLSAESSLLGFKLLGNPLLPKPETVKNLITNPLPVPIQLEENISEPNQLKEIPLLNAPKELNEIPLFNEPNDEQRESDIENIKNEIVKEEVKKIDQQVEFLNTQLQNVEKERITRQIKAEDEEKELKQKHTLELQNTIDSAFSTQTDIQRVKNRQEKELSEKKEKTEHEDENLEKKSDKLSSLVVKKTKLSKITLAGGKIGNIKHPRRSKKGAVKTLKKVKEDGGVSFNLKVPSDLDPEEVDEIEIDISKETSEILEKYNQVKSKIMLDKSLNNVSEEEKAIIKSAGKEFAKIKKDYVSKRTDKIKKRKALKKSKISTQ